MTLYVVATPIGNLADVSLRAREVLNSATLIVAEDTRTSGKLFKLLGIDGKKEFVSSHAQSSDTQVARAIERCVDHEVVALVTDAGTPAISDPGSFFISAFRSAYPESAVIPVPGVSAVIAALSVSGFPSSHYEFMGFIPHKKGRQTLFADIAAKEHCIVVYESPHRFIKTLQALVETIPERVVMIGREMTKQFEEYPVGTPTQLLTYYESHPDKVRGEFVIVIAPREYRPSRS